MKKTENIKSASTNRTVLDCWFECKFVKLLQKGFLAIVAEIKNMYALEHIKLKRNKFLYPLKDTCMHSKILFTIAPK